MVNTIQQWYNDNPFPGPYEYDDIADKDCLQNKFMSNINQHCKANKKVLDLGCGTGMMLNALAIHNPRCEFTGIDFSNAVGYAEHFAKTNAIQNVKYKQQDLFELDVEQKYDVVIAQSVLTHTKKWHWALEILKNLLSDKGILIVSVYNPKGKLLQKIMPKKITHQRLALDQYHNPIDMTVPYKYFIAGNSDYDVLKQVGSAYDWHNGGLITFNLKLNRPQAKVKKDCVHWLVNFVEKPHEFYNFKFPPCPFAKKVRIDNDMIIKSHHQGSIIKFAQFNINLLLESNKTVMVMFADVKHDTWINRYRLKLLNKFLVKHDRYLQVAVVETNGKEYFGILINRLSIVLDGHNFLKTKTEYYKNWTDSHYNIVVEDRNRLAKKYGHHQ